MRVRFGRPSPATAIASIALFVSLGGVSYGVATGSIDSRELKNNDVRTRDLRNNDVRTRDLRNNDVRGADIRTGTVTGSDVGANSLTGADILESSLGTVPSAGVAGAANSANTANRASSAASLDGLAKIRGFRRVASSGSNADQETAQAAATEVVLFTAGPLTVYGKCYTDTDNTAGDSGTYAEVFIKTSVNGAIFDSDDDLLDGSAAFLDTTTAENDRELEDAISIVDDSAIDADEDGNYAAVAADGTTIEGRVSMAAKNGNLAAGNGLYGAGNVCLFWGNQLG